MATGLQKWSTTAASNNTADSNVNWSEGQAPSTVNDSARAEMASAAKFRDDNNGSIVTSGTTAAFTAASNQVSTGNVSGYTVAVKFHGTADTSATLAVDGNTAANLQMVAGTNLLGGEIQAGEIWRFTYLSGSTAWVANSGGYLQTNNFANSSITLPKIANQATNTVLGNTVGSDGPPVAITLGTGLSVVSATSTAPTLSAPAFPPTASVKNLVIKVTGNTGATVAADFATLATGGSSSFTTMPVSSTINFGTSGSANQLDAGSLASGTSYAVWAIGSSTSTSADCVASTSFTTPLLPSGYDRKARVGAVVTSTTTASQQLMGTWQFGRRAQYVIGLAQTSDLPVVASGANGTNGNPPTWIAKSVTGLVPTTATKAQFILANNSAAVALMAPSNSYNGVGTTTAKPPPIVAVANTYASGEFVLESSSVYVACSNSGVSWAVLGWEDNI